MKYVPKFEYPPLERVTSESGYRYYIEPENGNHLTSVTTILSETSDETWLKEWRARVGDKKANAVSKEATDLGGLVHDRLENYAKGIHEEPGSNMIWRMAHSMADAVIAKGLVYVGEVWGIEPALYMPGLYAGTSDLIGEWKGEPAIIDYKTSKKEKGKIDIKDYAAQLSAYQMAHNNTYGTDIQLGVILMVTRDLQVFTYEYRGQEFRDAGIDFTNRLETVLMKQAADK